MSDIKKITKSTIIYLLGSVSSKLVAFLMLKLYTTYITPSDFGAFDVSITYVTLISSVLFLDIWNGIMRFVFDFKKPEDQHVVVRSGLLIFIGSIIAYSLVFTIFSRIIDFEYSFYIYLYGLTLCVQDLFGYLARAFGFNTIFAVSGLVSTIVNAVGNIIFIVYLDFDYRALYISYIAGVFIQVIMINKQLNIIRMIKGVKVDRDIAKNIFVFSLPLSINSASYWLLTSYSRIIIANKLGTEFNGYYAIASKFGVMITLVSFAFTMAWQEMAFSKADYDKETAHFYSKATELYLKFLISGTSILLPLIYFAFPYLVSKEYSHAKIIIPIYIIATVLSIFASFLGNILTAYKKTNVIFLSTLIASIVNLIVIYILIGRIGLLSAPIALLIGYFINSWIRIALIRKEIEYQIYLNRIIPLLLVLSISFITFYITSSTLNIFSIFIAILISFFVFRLYIKKIYVKGKSFFK